MEKARFWLRRLALQRKANGSFGNCQARIGESNMISSILSKYYAWKMDHNRASILFEFILIHSFTELNFDGKENKIRQQRKCYFSPKKRQVTLTYVYVNSVRSGCVSAHLQPHWKDVLSEAEEDIKSLGKKLSRWLFTSVIGEWLFSIWIYWVSFDYQGLTLYTPEAFIFSLKNIAQPICLRFIPTRS